MVAAHGAATGGRSHATYPGKVPRACPRPGAGLGTPLLGQGMRVRHRTWVGERGDGSSGQGSRPFRGGDPCSARRTVYRWAPCLGPTCTTDDVHLGPAPTAREEPHSPAKGYVVTSAPRGGDEHYKYCLLSIF